MPLVKKRLTIAAGATSDQVLQGTTYEYVDPGTQLVVAAGDATGTYSGQVTMDFTVNNASAIVTGKLGQMWHQQQWLGVF